LFNADSKTLKTDKEKGKKKKYLIFFDIFCRNIWKLSNKNINLHQKITKKADMDIREKLNKLIKTFGPTQAEFARKIGTTQPTIANWMAANRIPSKGIYKICSTFEGVEAEWLEDEESDWRGNHESSMGTRGIRRVSKPMLENPIPMGVPLFSNVTATCGLQEMSVNDLTTERVVLPGFQVDYYVPASGRSMLPTIQPGDIVGLRSWNDVQALRPGMIYLFETTNDEYILKRVRKIDPKSECITLYSDNEEEFEPFEIRKDSIHSIYRVVNLIRRLE